MFKVIVMIILAIVLSMNSEKILFEEKKAAFVNDEEFYENTDIQIALGPRPRFVKASIEGFYYSGDEFIFSFYSNYCAEWREKNGYAPPRWHSDRKKILTNHINCCKKTTTKKR